MNSIFRSLISLFFILYLASNSNAQETGAEKYKKEAISFLTEVKKKELADATFTLVDVPKYSCFTYTVDDSVSFTKEERQQIADEIEFPRISDWRTMLPPNIRFLDHNFVLSHTKLIKNPKRETKRFQKYFGGCYYHFSAPIFLKNYTFCLLYVDKICAAGKSSGELQLFEKVDGMWKQMISRCEWTE